MDLEHTVSASGTKVFESDQFYEFWFRGEIGYYSTPEKIDSLIKESESADKKIHKDLPHQVKIISCILIFRDVSFMCDKTEAGRLYKKILPFLGSAKRHVDGQIFEIIQKIEYKHGRNEIVYAPAKWKCSVCLTSANSHMCVKTKCGHFFHHGCYIHLTSPICPLCRQDIV